jgi:hypothetical protein
MMALLLVLLGVFGHVGDDHFVVSDRTFVFRFVTSFANDVDVAQGSVSVFQESRVIPWA